MKTILYTGYDEAYKPLADLTYPLMAEYAERHGLYCTYFDTPPDGLNIYWTGIARALELFDMMDCDRVIYLDADQMITNPERPPVFDPGYGFWASKDWGNDAVEPWHFSACGWIAHRDCIPMFEAVLKMEPEWRDKEFQEQGPWREWMRIKMDNMSGTMRAGKPTDPPAFINIMSRRFLNAVPDQVCPGNVPEPWKPGDFAAHITMVDIKRRVEIFHEIERTLNEKHTVHPGREEASDSGA